MDIWGRTQSVHVSGVSTLVKLCGHGQQVVINYKENPTGQEKVFTVVGVHKRGVSTRHKVHKVPLKFTIIVRDIVLDISRVG